MTQLPPIPTPQHHHNCKGANRCKVGVEPTIDVKKPHDDGKRVQEFHPVFTPYFSGMNTRGGDWNTVAHRPRGLAMAPCLLDSRCGPSGGSPEEGLS